MRESVTEANSAGTIRIINWYYDALNRLEAEDYNDIDDSNDFEHDYIYDLVGNRLQRQVIAGDGNDTLYYYNDNDQLTREFTDVNTHYTYNANGSLIQEANDVATLKTFTYNYRNRLEDVNDGTNSVSYAYNPSGIRVNADIYGGTATDYLIDPYNHTGYAQVFKEIGDSNTVFVLGHDVIAQATGTSDPNYFIYDGHGSVRHLANNSGTIVESYNYDAYGNAHGFTPGNAATKLLFSGEYYDSTATQYYLRARWYDPSIGRFNRMDPFAGNNHDPQSLHKYNYVHNNPVNSIDPSGKFISLGGLIKGITIGAVIIGILSFTYSKLGIGTYRRGINIPIITDKDIKDFLNGLRIARRGIYWFTKGIGSDRVPDTWEGLWDGLHSHNIYQVGLLGEGPVGPGQTTSAGYQQIISYYETRIWNWLNPEATPHRSPAAYHGVNSQLYIMEFGDWSLQRYNIIARDLAEKAQDRRNCAPEDIEKFLHLSDVRSEMNISKPYTGEWR